jgi:hypothetical protein
MDKFFRPNVTGIWTFWTTSDDASFLWIGPNATDNAIVNNKDIHEE